AHLCFFESVARWIYVWIYVVPAPRYGGPGPLLSLCRRSASPRDAVAFCALSNSVRAQSLGIDRRQRVLGWLEHSEFGALVATRQWSFLSTKKSAFRKLSCYPRHLVRDLMVRSTRSGSARRK